jgi:hypothetical protein
MAAAKKAPGKTPNGPKKSETRKLLKKINFEKTDDTRMLLDIQKSKVVENIVACFPLWRKERGTGGMDDFLSEVIDECNNEATHQIEVKYG